MSDEPLLAGLLSTRGRLYVVSGPSGVGKDAVLAAMFRSEARPAGLGRCVTATTRQARPDERDGVDYLFLRRAEFEDRIARGFFLEHAVYNGDLYGTPRASVEAERESGRDVLLKIEVQGALQVRQTVPEAILIFIAPPSWAELERRLRGRLTDDPASVAERLHRARSELSAAPAYDYLVVNDMLEQAARGLAAIIAAERHRIVRPPAG